MVSPVEKELYQWVMAHIWTSKTGWGTIPRLRLLACHWFTLLSCKYYLTMSVFICYINSMLFLLFIVLRRNDLLDASTEKKIKTPWALLIEIQKAEVLDKVRQWVQARVRSVSREQDTRGFEGDTEEDTWLAEVPANLTPSEVNRVSLSPPQILA